MITAASKVTLSKTAKSRNKERKTKRQRKICTIQKMSVCVGGVRVE